MEFPSPPGAPRGSPSEPSPPPSGAEPNGPSNRSIRVLGLSPLLFPILAGFTVPLWLLLLPVAWPDWPALAGALVSLVGALIGFHFVGRLKSGLVDVGWSLLCYLLLLECLRELTPQLAFVEAFVRGPLQLAWLCAVVVGLRHFHSRLDDELRESRQAQEKAELRNHDLSSLNRISEIALGSEASKLALEEVVKEVARATGFLVVAIEIYNEKTQRMLCQAVSGIPIRSPGEGMAVPLEQSDANEVVRTGSPVFESDISVNPLYRASRLRNMGIKTFFCVPLRLEKTVIGSLTLGHHEPTEPTPWLRQSASQYAKHIAFLLERESSQRVRQREERYARAVRGANDGLWDLDLRQGRIYYSERWKSMLGYEEGEIGWETTEWFGRVHPSERVELEGTINAHLEGKTAHFEFEHRVLHKDGEYRWMLSRGLAVRDEEGRAVRMAGSQTDVTDRKKAEERLLHGAFHDSLTGLPNRALFTDRVERALARAERRPDYLFAVMFLDLDRFKVLNDSLGHMSGDRLLLGVAKRLSECLRPGDTVARLGGDEFTVLLDDLSGPAEVHEIATRIQKSLAAPFCFDGKEITTSASIGVTFSGQGRRKPEELLRDADTAMYRAKSSQGQWLSVFEPSMHEHAMGVLEVETDLRNALAGDQLVIHYQPIVGVESGKIEGLEALLRWVHPQRGLLPPSEFVHIAEETQLIVEITEWLLHTACRQVKQFVEQDSNPLFVSVNVAACHFQRDSLVNTVRDAIGSLQLQPAALQIELTESTLMEQLETTSEVLEQLRKMGARIAIDDFGTGYSSLSYLTRFPIHTLKIDRSFVRDVTGNPHNTEIVRAVVTLANSLKLEVTAEGVENADEFAFLRSIHCSHVQGYFFCRPGPVEEIAEVLRGWTGPDAQRHEEVRVRSETPVAL